MATISENLQIIKNSTDAIKQAIIDKGGTIEGDITTWADAINGISGGGSNSTFQITNKLNGQLFGGPDWHGETDYQYTFSDEVQSITFMPVSITFPNVEYFINSGNYFQISETGVLEMSNHIDNSVADIYGDFYLSMTNQGKIYFLNEQQSTYENSQKPMKIIVIASDIEGNTDTDYFFVQAAANQPCFVKNTLITLSDSTVKPVQDITYNDNLLVWNFDECKYDTSKPLWIKKVQLSSSYYKIVLDNNTILKLVGSNGKCHRLFSIEDGMFISATDMVGKTTYTLSGKSKVVSCELIEEVVEFYNIITSYHINLFANGVLTSCRYNNIYPIKDMQFIKENIIISNNSKEFNNNPVLHKYCEGLRLNEQHNFSIEDMIKYCARLENLKLEN